MQKFPHAPYTKDLYLTMIPIVLPLLLLISYGLLAADLVREVTEQRILGIKVGSSSGLFVCLFFLIFCKCRCIYNCSSLPIMFFLLVCSISQCQGTVNSPKIHKYYSIIPCYISRSF